MTTTGTPLLELDRIVKSYGAVRAVRGVSFVANRGEIVAVVGENGAGKSTIMRILAGIESADSGQVLIDGQSAELDTPANARKHGISIVPQELTLCLDMSVRDNILLGDYTSSLFGVIDFEAIDAEVVSRLDYLGTPGMSTTSIVRELSFVEQAFVQIARAIRHDTRLLIMDEPTAPMSQSEVDQLHEVLRNLAARDVAVLYISHRLEEVAELANRAVVLRDGEIASELDGKHLNLQELVRAMVGDVALTQRDNVESKIDGEVRLSVERVHGRTLKDVSLTVRAGEIVAVYGVLGSGFEELGSAIVDARVLEGGRIVMNGTDVSKGGMPMAVRSGFGYVPPERRTQGLNLSGSVANNIAIGLLSLISRFGMIRQGQMAEIVDRWIAELRIKTPSSETLVGSLSGGSQQKVLMARWLAAGSTVFVLEEPTRGVDIATKRELYEVFRDEARKGAAILIISSDLEEISEISDRVLVVRSGEIVAELNGALRSEIAESALRTN